MDTDRLIRLEVVRVAGRVKGYDFEDLQQEARLAAWQHNAREPAHVRRWARTILNRLRLASITQSRHPTDRVGRLLSIVCVDHDQTEAFATETRGQIEARLILDALRRENPTQFAWLVAHWEQHGSLTCDDPQCESALSAARRFIDGGNHE